MYVFPKTSYVGYLGSLCSLVRRKKKKINLLKLVPLCMLSVHFTNIVLVYRQVHVILQNLHIFPVDRSREYVIALGNFLYVILTQKVHSVGI